MAQTFEEYVDEWLSIKKEAKRLAELEMNMRKAIMQSIRNAKGDEFKEGANTLAMGDGRKITCTHKVNRIIDQSQIEVIREEYNALNDRPVPFDDLLKVKYDLVIGPFRKLEGRALEVISDLVTSKEGSPEIVVKD